MNLRQVRKKVKSITNVKKITKAMELVSGIKMRKAQAIEVDGRPYRNNLDVIIQKIAPGIDPSFSALSTVAEGARSKELIIYVSSNKGLCGAFNVNLFRYLYKTVDVKSADFITIGKKGATMIGRIGGTVIADYSSNIPLNQVSAVFTMALGKFLAKEYSKISVVYTKFVSTLKSIPTREIILPVSITGEVSKEEDKKEQSDAEYLVEPSPVEILDALLRSFVEEKIRGAVISSEAVEHSARMIAMKNATDNANDVIYNFTLLGNRLRQEKITNELLDMVTAKESVESN